ncbi:MAG: choice-of-anchor D domain-containing protein, partial [Candidatus Acidiferrum sp.]
MERSRVLPVHHASRGVSYFWRPVSLVLAVAASLVAGGCGQMSTDGARAQQPGVQSKIVLVPNSIDFSSVVLGQKNSQTVKLTNGDTKRIHITNVSIAGAGLSVGGVTLPLSLDPQASETFNLEFAPKSSGPVSGTLTIESTVPTETFNVKGTGTKAKPRLQTDPASIDFGKIAVKKTTTRQVTVSNTGNSKITVNKVALSGSGFSVSDLPSQFSLEPLQTTTFQVTFHPQAKGSVKGSLSFTSKDLSSPVAMALAGNAVDPGSVPASSGHTVNLEWDASP